MPFCLNPKGYFKATKSFAVFVSFLFSIGVQAQDALFWRYPGYNTLDSALESADPNQSFQVSVFGQNSHNTLQPPAWGFGFWYAPFGGKSLKTSGWILTGGIAVSDETDLPLSIFSPGANLFEVGIGRAFLFDETFYGVGKDMGFRGHLEVVYRGASYLQTSIDRASVLNRDLTSQNRALFLKWGSGTHLWSDGLVDQKPSFWGIHLEGQLGVPIRNAHSVIFDLSTKLFVACGAKGVRCGTEFQYFNVSSAFWASDYQDVKRVFQWGPYFEWNSKWKLNLRMSLPWYWIQGGVQLNSSAESVLRYRKLPGVAIGLSYGL